MCTLVHQSISNPCSMDNKDVVIIVLQAGGIAQQHPKTSRNGQWYPIAHI